MYPKTVGVTWDEEDIGFAILGGLLLGLVAAVRWAVFGRLTGPSGLMQKSFALKCEFDVE
jgi:hypothetical protein